MTPLKASRAGEANTALSCLHTGWRVRARPRWFVPDLRGENSRPQDLGRAALPCQAREIRAPYWQQLSWLQLLGGGGALLSPSWQGPENEYLTIEIFIECEEARRHNSTVRKEDSSKWSDSISYCQTGDLQDLVEQGSPWERIWGGGKACPKVTVLILFFSSRQDLKPNQNTMKRGEK